MDLCSGSVVAWILLSQDLDVLDLTGEVRCLRFQFHKVDSVQATYSALQLARIVIWPTTQAHCGLSCNPVIRPSFHHKLNE